MGPELKNLLITLPLLGIMLGLVFWLVRTLVTGPGGREGRVRDRLEAAGYEPIQRIRRKEFAVMGLGGLAIVLCLGVMGLLVYWLVTADLGDGRETSRLLELLLMFLPALAMLGLVIAASRRYLRMQQTTLEEFRVFKARRDKAIGEYREKRRGGSASTVEPKKKQPARRERNKAPKSHKPKSS